jgi:hypothetical protein
LSKQLLPTFKDLAIKLRDAKDLVIAKFDVENNDYPLLYYKTIPSIRFYPRSEKLVADEFEDYDGGPEVTNLLNWITGHSKVFEEQMPELYAE